MSTDDINQNNSVATSHLQVSSSEVQDELQSKVTELKEKELEQLIKNQATAQNLPYIDLTSTAISQDALTIVSEEQARALGVIPFLFMGKELRLGAVNPQNPQLLALVSDLTKRLNTHAVVYLISERSFQWGIELYKNLPKLQPTEIGVSLHEDDLQQLGDQLKSFRDLEKIAAQTPTTKLMSLLLAGGLKSESSDIHLEAEEDKIIIRYRLDGLLHQVATLPKETWNQLVSRIKLLAHLKLNIVSEAQDGSFSISLPNDRVEVRVSTVPTAFGESVVLRLLRSSQTGLEFEDLGLRGRAFQELLQEIKRPNGLILTTGPTGSGKTTTLYAILNKLNRPEVKIATLEDPIEYRLTGINQSQINMTANYTFAKGLRAILRQDPDIIMVGEIRDTETADTAVNAALTGHLVISTLHTNDAAGALPRLLSLGVKPFLLAPAINALIGQRLVRKICDSCKKEIKLDKDTLQRVENILKAIPPESGSALTEQELHNLTFYQGSGCEACHNLGYRYRTGIYEVFSMNLDIERTILSGQVSEYQVRELITKAGMVTMVQDGLLKAKDGITTVEEVFRVVE